MGVKRRCQGMIPTFCDLRSERIKLSVRDEDVWRRSRCRRVHQEFEFRPTRVGMAAAVRDGAGPCEGTTEWSVLDKVVLKRGSLSFC